MFYLSRRQARAAMSAAAGAAVYLAASEIGARKLKLSALFVLASASMAGLAASASTGHTKAVAVNTRDRFNNLLNNGGRFNGNIVVNGDHHVLGSLYGTSGTLTSGDNLHGNGNAGFDDFVSVGNYIGVTNGITMGGHINGVGNVSVPGGAPGSYSAAYETSLQSCLNNIVTRL